MWNINLYLVIATAAIIAPSSAIWQCASDSECTSLTGSVCVAGACACPANTQNVAGGTFCAEYAPYYTSTCVEDFQCSRLFTAFQCRYEEDQTDETDGKCFCQPNHHYFHGRCWQTMELAEPCSRDEECMGIIRDPFSMVCDQTCQCAGGYYNRQRGECRKIGAAVGDGCVLDEDCQFTNGLCDDVAFICYDSTNPSTHTSPLPSVHAAENTTLKMAVAKMARQHGAVCSAVSPCPAPFECSSWGQCVCPLGYYGSEDGSSCLAELGSPSTAEQCVGLFTVVQNGICTCPANFFFDENMRDCLKVARRITDFCMSDSQCHTFGATAFCGAPEQWGLRTCECDLEQAVWDAERSMCRLFAGIGEPCDVDSDCMAGDLEIQCALNADGQGYCACPDGLTTWGGLCLTTGLGLGDSCQVAEECTGTSNTVCEDGQCSCDAGYQEVDGFCAPSIGGACAADSDCAIDNTECVSGDAGLTCECREEFVEYSAECWQISTGYNATCTVDAQCGFLGTNAACIEGSCLCDPSSHYRDGGCWPITGLFEACSRSSQCYLGDLTETVVCRNGLCQCDFNYPYSEELQTCISSATVLSSSILLLVTSLAYLLSY